jgi:hypothetical protein
MPRRVSRSPVARRSGVFQHDRQDVGVEHSLDGDAVGGGIESGDASHGMHQRLPVVRSGASHQRSVDVEQDECAIAQLPIIR